MHSGARHKKGLADCCGLSERLVQRTAPLIAALAVVLVLSLSAPALAAEACPNEQLRVEDNWSLALPDCRAYEQVSPVAKNLNDAYGTPLGVYGSPAGEAVTFFSTLAFPGGVGADQFPIYVSARQPDGWLTHDFIPPTDVGVTGGAPAGVTEDLSFALVESNSEPPLSPQALEGRFSLYLYDIATGSYTLLTQVQPNESGGGQFYFVGAAAGDSRIFFETQNRLLPQASLGKSNVYEWHEGQLSLIDVLPQDEGGAAPSDGAAAGTGSGFYKQDVVSPSGSRVFFTDAGNGRIYVREPQAVPATTIPVSEGDAQWLTATPDGSQMFYLEGEELYRFDVEDARREALTSGEAGVKGMLGTGGEGSYVYFAASGVLAAGASEASGQVNLYLLHEGVVTFIAEVRENPGEKEVEVEADWRLGPTSNDAGPGDGGRSSRVSADGGTLLFTSTVRLTGYENAGFVELYLYSAASGRLSCVSCNPSGAPASSGARLSSNAPRAATSSLGEIFQERNLSADGERVFFQSEEALVAQDINGQADVYEWEAEGEGSCPSGHGGCIYLISSGQSPEPSYFAEAGANGDSVFFFTRQSLVGQDTDNNQDLYDARIGGGLAAQNPPASLAPCTGDACRGAPGSSPSLGAPVSQVFSGPGNLAPPAESTPATKLKVKPLSRAQQLAKALEACRRKPRQKRAACESKARKRYAIKAMKTTRSARVRRSIERRGS
jgi:hypothetical protein